MENNEMVKTDPEVLDVAVEEQDNKESNTQEVVEESIEVKMNKLFSKAFTTLPMIIRVKYLIDTLDKIPDDQVSFSRINSILFTNVSDGDFNITCEIKSKEDILNLYNRICSAVSGLSAWHKRVCKDCGKEFFMYLSEVDFYKNKGFALPKRCKSCINAHKNQQK